MSNDVAQLPDDPALLKRIIADRDRYIEAMEQRHQAELDAVLRRFYGPRSEKFDPTELLLFGLNVAEQVPVDPGVVEAESGEKLATRRVNHHRHGRRTLPEHLPRIEVVHDLSDEQKKCPCCGEVRACIGSETSEQLEYVPASLKVLNTSATSTPASPATPPATGATSRSPRRRHSRSRRDCRGRGCWLT